MLTQACTYEDMVSEIEEAYRTGDMPRLETFVLKNRQRPSAGFLLGDPRVEPLIPSIRAAYCEYETRDELRLRDKLIKEATPRIAGSEPVERTFRYAPLEAVAAGINDHSRYCHVGSGPLPETLLAMRSVAPYAALTGVDADPEMARLGREFVEVAWPGGAISFWPSAGDDIDYRGFTHVHIAVLVRPEFDVVRCVCETADSGVTIMLRTAEGLGGLLYQPIAERTKQLLGDHGFRLHTTVRSHTVMNTELYRR